MPGLQTCRAMSHHPRHSGWPSPRLYSVLPRAAHQGFDRHTLVNVAHADRKIDGRELDDFVVGIFDFFPTDVATASVNFDAGLILLPRSLLEKPN